MAGADDNGLRVLRFGQLVGVANTLLNQQLFGQGFVDDALEVANAGRLDAQAIRLQDGDLAAEDVTIAGSVPAPLCSRWRRERARAAGCVG
ncbi:MAG: hypothetical protein WBM40_09685 [Thiohalocapsa sp.]